MPTKLIGRFSAQVLLSNNPDGLKTTDLRSGPCYVLPDEELQADRYLMSLEGQPTGRLC